MQPRLHTAVVELTLACDQHCLACGSDAGQPRADELSTREWKQVFHSLAALGCRRLTFSGGEPLLRRDWQALVRAAVRAGLRPDLITSGAAVDLALARQARRAGLRSITVSVDGAGQAHDRLRGRSGSFAQALAAIRLLDGAGLRVGVSTQVNRISLPTLDALAGALQDAGALGWQLQLTMPSGRSSEKAALLCTPDDMPAVHATIRRLHARTGLRPFVTDNIGYLTADDAELRSSPFAPGRVWLGCFAGLTAVAVASDGGVKGCLSLPDSCREGNVRAEPLERIWADEARFAYNRAFTPASLAGACAACAQGALCRGGCTAMAMAVHGRAGVSTHCLRLACRDLQR